MTFDTDLAARLVAEAMEDARRCPDCHGDGFKAYSDTTCGRGGGGGQMITTADCRRCKSHGWLTAVDIKALASQLAAAIVELNSYRDTEGTNAVCFDKVVAERDALRADCERMRRDYLTVADAVAAESTGPEDLATKARATRAECERLRAFIDAVDRCKVDGPEYVIGSLVAERDQARSECEHLNKYIATHDEEYATMKETLRTEHQECQRLRADLAAALKAKDEACEIAERRGAALDYLDRQVDGYDVIKEVAREIEHGVVDVDGRARIPGAVVQPDSAPRISQLRKVGTHD